MDNLKDYLNKYDNSGFDEEVPAGNEERFEAMYESYRHRIRFQSSVKRRKKSFWKVALIPVAASFALIFIVELFLNPLMKEQEDTHVAKNMTAEQAYNEYLEQLDIRTNEIMQMAEKMKDEDVIFVMQTLKDIVRENRPFPDVLSDDIPENKKVEAIEAFAKHNIAAVDEYKTVLAQTLLEKY